MPHSVHDTPRSRTPEGSPMHFWNANLPREQWTETCPDFLLGQSDKNKRILSTKDEDWKYYSWEDTQELIRTNRLDLFERTPGDLRRYLHYMYNLKNSYGSVLAFVQHERLHWDVVTPSGDAPFSNPTDYTILFNDWPYALDREITHLVVWTKFSIEEDVEKDDLTPEARVLLEYFVSRTFCDAAQGGISRDKVVWFKNWRSLKSVHALEHFHVLLYKCPQAFLERVTKGDQAMSAKLKDSEQRGETAEE